MRLDFSSDTLLMVSISALDGALPVDGLEHFPAEVCMRFSLALFSSCEFGSQLIDKVY